MPTPALSSRTCCSRRVRCSGVSVGTPARCEGGVLNSEYIRPVQVAGPDGLKKLCQRVAVAAYKPFEGMPQVQRCRFCRTAGAGAFVWSPGPRRG